MGESQGIIKHNIDNPEFFSCLGRMEKEVRHLTRSEAWEGGGEVWRDGGEGWRDGVGNSM